MDIMAELNNAGSVVSFENCLQWCSEDDVAATNRVKLVHRMKYCFL